MKEWILKVVILTIKNVKRKKGSFDQDFKGYSKITLSYNECKRLKNFLSVFGCPLK